MFVYVIVLIFGCLMRRVCVRVCLYMRLYVLSVAWPCGCLCVCVCVNVYLCACAIVCGCMYVFVLHSVCCLCVSAVFAYERV